MIHSLAQLYQLHPALLGALAMALANAAITAMPSPVFNFLHSAVGAISRVVAQYKNGNGNGNPPEAA
jgi:hypothetical protein